MSGMLIPIFYCNTCQFAYSISDQSPGRYDEIPQISAVKTAPMVFPRTIPAVRVSTKFQEPPNAKLYRIAELQFATNNFSEENFLGEGSLGSVYKAEFPDGQVHPPILL